MTKTVEEVRRELFESIWPMPSNCMRCGNTYAATSYNAWQAAEFINRWEGFNKALDAVEIELPKEVAAGRWADDTGYFRDDVIEAIHAAGVKTK